MSRFYRHYPELPDPEPERVACLTCDGEGEFQINVSPLGKGGRRDPQCDESVRCPDCHGTGEVPA